MNFISLHSTNLIDVDMLFLHASNCSSQRATVIQVTHELYADHLSIVRYDYARHM